MNHGSAIHFLQQARWRFRLNAFFEWLAVGIAAACAGALVLLLLGTDLMSWLWLPALAIAGVGLASVQGYRKRLGDYRFAQLLDRRLALQDRLATVVWSTAAARPPIPPERIAVVEAQLEGLIHPKDVRRAVPLAMPRAAYAALGLAAAALGLVGVRYGLLQTLDVRQPIADLHWDVWAPNPPAVQASIPAARPSAIEERYQQQLQQLGIGAEDVPSENKALSPVESKIPAAGKSADGERGDRNGKQGAADGDGASDNEGDAGQPPAPGERAADKDKAEQPPKEAEKKSDGERDALIDRMRDALANLLNKMKVNQEGLPQSASNNGEKGKAGREDQNGKEGTPGKGKSESEGDAKAADPNGEQRGDAQKAAGNQSKAGAKATDQPGSQQARSGMGSQDGEKQIREAQQLKAMGKISEIFGRRAAELSGETTVEVSSRNQQLRTAYSDKRATHTDVGAEANRDEIPLAYRSYVQRYYQELRKLEASATKKVEP